jgi:DNA-binding response OmpR family regulator
MQSPQVRRPLSAAKILIIDDDLVFVRLVAHALEQRHYKVETASDGYEGLSKFESIQPNLVLCDLNMPGLTGFQVLTKLRKLSDEVPIIVISGADKIQDAVEAMKCGAWDYLEKPIENFDILLDAVVKSLRKASLMKENGMLRARKISPHSGSRVEYVKCRVARRFLGSRFRFLCHG